MLQITAETAHRLKAALVLDDEIPQLKIKIKSANKTFVFDVDSWSPAEATDAKNLFEHPPQAPKAPDTIPAKRSKSLSQIQLELQTQKIQQIARKKDKKYLEDVKKGIKLEKVEAPKLERSEIEDRTHFILKRDLRVFSIMSETPVFRLNANICLLIGEYLWDKNVDEVIIVNQSDKVTVGSPNENRMYLSVAIPDNGIFGPVKYARVGVVSKDQGAPSRIYQSFGENEDASESSTWYELAVFEERDVKKGTEEKKEKKDKSIKYVELIPRISLFENHRLTDNWQQTISILTSDSSTIKPNSNEEVVKNQQLIDACKPKTTLALFTRSFHRRSIISSAKIEIVCHFSFPKYIQYLHSRANRKN